MHSLPGILEFCTAIATHLIRSALDPKNPAQVVVMAPEQPNDCLFNKCAHMA
jgi:hypothetical protein